MSSVQKTLTQVLSDGLNLSSLTPYQELAEKLNLSEEQVIININNLINDNSIKRFGIVTKNRELGFNQNAMVVLNVLDDQIDKVAEKIIENQAVTLCYQRIPIQGVWEFNLYFMIHGRDRLIVESEIGKIIQIIGEDCLNHKVLFSSKCFKQKGARYV